MHLFIKIFLSLIVLLGIALPSEAVELNGKVLWLYDGDSFKMETAGHKIVQVRFYGIDAPEKGQPGSRMALQAIIKLLKNQSVRVVKVDIDKYNRIVGKVYLGKLYVNLWMLNNGYAWHFKFFSQDKDLSQAETKAQQAKLGIWKLSGNIPPWHYRKTKHFKK
ncbi:MAG: thermonuclease family protein [Victivallaceae bacterium]|nr:thermonuclease family protein [Victivallaceae bacterium]